MCKISNFSFILLLSIIIFGCNTPKNDNITTPNSIGQEVNLYSDRHYEVDNEIFEEFTNHTGIQVNLIRAQADELINRLEQEGKNSPADILVTVDAGRLYRAQEKGLLQSVKSEALENNIPSLFRDPEGHWFGLTYRARVIVYDSNRVNPSQVSSYEALTGPSLKGKVLVRSSENIYNQSLLASMIASQGEEAAKKWAKETVNNMARSPKGNDRDQMKAIVAGIGNVAIVNTYYVANMINSADTSEREVGSKMKVIFPNQNGRGTHVNISGAGVVTGAPNKENAIKLLEFLSSAPIQEKFAKANFEYPVKNGVKKAPILESWGEFKMDTLNMALLGKYNKQAIMAFNEVGWQ